MSKNHPNDNIYSILGKLEALKPTPEEKRFALVKEIRESVEAKGSVLEGVSAVEAKLRKDFAESDFSKMSTAIQKTGKSKASADAITAAAGREKLGQKEMTRRSVAGRKDECTGCAMGECSVHGMMENDDDQFSKILDACAAIYRVQFNGGDEIWDKDWMQDWASELEQANPTDQELDFIIAKGQMPKRLADVQFSTGDDFQFSEAETTHTGGEKVATAKGTIHKSKATVDTEKLLSRGDVTDPDAEETPSAPTVKQGRGRPKMDTKDRSQAKMPWGGNPPKDTYKHQKGSLVHKISEGRLIDESGETLDHILNRFKHDVKRFEAGEDIYNTDLYHALFDYYSENGEMPYGTQKARDGDPVEFIHDRLDMLLADKAYGKDPANAEGYGIEDEAIGDPQPGIPGNLPVPGKMDRLNQRGPDYMEEFDPMEKELNELALLAGLKESTEFSSTPDESSDFNISTSMSSDGNKNVTVSATGEHAASLLQMLRIAGLGDGDKAHELEQEPEMGNDEGAEVLVIGGNEEPEVAEDAVDYDAGPLDQVNAPHETYGSIKTITTQGDDLNREKTQDPGTANKAANPMTNAQNTLKSVAQLESKLAAEYESIKKVSK